MIVIALDTPTEPQDAADALFATDNFKAGVLIGQYAKAAVEKAGITPKIATLDLAPGHLGRRAAPQRLPEGLRHQGGRPADRRRRRHAEGDQAKGQTAMENCCRRTRTSTSSTRSTSRPAFGAYTALKAAGKDEGRHDRLRRRRLQRRQERLKAGIIAATSQQYPLKMAALGVEAVVDDAKRRQEAVRLHRHRRDADHRQADGRRRHQGRRLRHGELLGLEPTGGRPVPAGRPLAAVRTRGLDSMTQPQAQTAGAGPSARQPTPAPRQRGRRARSRRSPAIASRSSAR